VCFGGEDKHKQCRTPNEGGRIQQINKKRESAILAMKGIKRMENGKTTFNGGEKMKVEILREPSSFPLKSPKSLWPLGLCRVCFGGMDGTNNAARPTKKGGCSGSTKME
jgi:hypothetical protein